MLNDQSNASPYNETQRSTGFVQKQLPEVFCKKGVFKNLANFTGKHLCWSLFLIKLLQIGPESLLKLDSNMEICEIFKNTYFEEHLPTDSLLGKKNESHSLNRSWE